MRKLVLSLAAIVALTTSGFAQAKFGFKAGANLAKLKETASNISITLDTKVGFHGGFFVTAPIASGLSVQPELLYSMEGGKLSDGVDKATIDLNFVNVPVMLQYNASGFIAETGPQLGLLLSAKAKANGQSQDLKDQLNSVNFSWAVGAGYRLANGFGLHARYNFGLSNLDKDSNSGSTSKSNVLMLGLSIALSGGTSN